MYTIISGNPLIYAHREADLYFQGGKVVGIFINIVLNPF